MFQTMTWREFVGQLEEDPGAMLDGSKVICVGEGGDKVLILPVGAPDPKDPMDGVFIHRILRLPTECRLVTTGFLDDGQASEIMTAIMKKLERGSFVLGCRAETVLVHYTSQTDEVVDLELALPIQTVFLFDPNDKPMAVTIDDKGFVYSSNRI